MSQGHELSTTTVHIQLPDDFLNSLKKGRKGSDTDPNIILSDTENPVYRELLNNIYDAVIICDLKGKILDFNHRAVDFLLHTSEELRKTNIKNIIMGLTEDTLISLKTNADKKLLSLMEGTCLRYDKSNFPSEITVNKITLNDNEYLIFSIRNIQRRKEAELNLKGAYQKLNISNKQLQDREKELGYFQSFALVSTWHIKHCDITHFIPPGSNKTIFHTAQKSMASVIYHFCPFYHFSAIWA